MIKFFQTIEEERFWDYLRFNAYRSERHKLLYVATPKVACTSLKWWFAELEGISVETIKAVDSAETGPELIIHDSLGKVAPNVTGLDAGELERIFASDGYCRFALVRNPYKRVFSAWQSKLLLREPLQTKPYLNCDFLNLPLRSMADIALAFEAFLEYLAKYEAPNFLDIHWTPQVNLLRPDLVDYTKLTKIENSKELSEELSKHCGSLIPDPFANHLTNESLILYSEELITDKSKSLIQSLYWEDFEYFEYPIELPITSNKLSIEQLDTAIKAICFIQGRHQRFGDVREAQQKNAAELADLSVECDHLKSTVESMLTSRSWRMTHPLRVMAKLLRDWI